MNDQTLPPLRKVCTTCNKEWFQQPEYEWQTKFPFYQVHERCPQCKAQKVIELPGWGYVIFQTYTHVGDIYIWKPDRSWGDGRAAIQLPGGEDRPSYTVEEMQKFAVALTEAIEYAKKLEEPS